MMEHQFYFVPSTWKRVFAWWLDQVFIWMVLAPILMMFPQTEDGWIQLSLPWAIMLFLYPVLFETLALYFLNTTPGKWIFNLRVVAASPAATEHWGVHVLIRSLISYFGIFFWAIIATAFFRYDRTHLADWIAETRVVGSHAGRSPKLRPVFGMSLLILGLVQGWASMTVQISNVEYEDGFIYIPDPTSFASEMEDEE